MDNATSVTIKIKTPTETWSSKRKTSQLSDFMKMIEANTYSQVLNNIAENAEVAINQTLSIVATFFQRVVARTPLDEDYSWTEEITVGKDKNGNPIKEKVTRYHKADSSQVRYSWTIK